MIMMMMMIPIVKIMTETCNICQRLKPFLKIWEKAKGFGKDATYQLLLLNKKNAAVSTTHTQNSQVCFVSELSHIPTKLLPLKRQRYTVGSKYHGNLDTKSYYFKVF
jgi:hypothetical protein